MTFLKEKDIYFISTKLRIFKRTKKRIVFKKNKATKKQKQKKSYHKKKVYCELFLIF